ncbi:MAG: two-component regulator propeller domain-containing protein [Rhodothermales bacterium]
MASRPFWRVRAWRVCAILGLLLASAPAGAGAQHYVSRTYGVEEGLVQSQVNAFFQDSKGHLWIGTMGGVSQFDGIYFVNSTVENGLSGNQVTAFTEDADGRIWIGTDRGITVYVNDRFHRMPLEGELGTAFVTDLLRTSDNTIWIATTAGLGRYQDGHLLRYTTEAGLPDNVLLALNEGPDGRLWIATRDGFCSLEAGYRFDCHHPEALLPARQIDDILVDRDGRVHIASFSGTAVMEDGTITVTNDAMQLPVDRTTVLLIDDEGAIWAGTDGGITRRERSGETTVVSKSANLLVRALFEDREGNIWAGTSGQGVIQLRHTAFTQQNAPLGIDEDVILAVHEDALDRLWIGTLTQGAFVRDGDALRHYTAADGLASNHVRAFARDARGDMWIATAGGVSRLHAGRLLPPMLTNYYVYTVLATSTGAVYAGSINGLARIDGEAIIPIRTTTPAMSTIVYTLREDERGVLWAGTSRGLGYIEGDSLVLLPALADIPVASITPEADSLLWLGTQGYGVLRFDRHRGVVRDTISTADGLNGGTVYFTVSDADGYLWIGTSRGVNRFDVGHYRDAGEIMIRSFGKFEGIIGVETNMNAAVVDTRNRLWFGTILGLMQYDASVAPQKTAPPPIHVNEIRLFWEPFTPKADATPTFDHDQNHITFDYHGLSFTNPELLRYQYYLEGFDDGWLPLTESRTATYANLPPGDYTFHVRARSNAGVWSDTPATYRLVITPPFWLRPWFIALSSLGALALVFGIVQLRTYALNQRRKRLEEMVTSRTAELERTHTELLATREKALAAAQAKTNFMAAITHELRTPMNGIMGMNDLLFTTDLDGEQKEYAATIADCSRSLMEIIENLLTFSDLAGSQREVSIEHLDMNDLLIDAIGPIRRDAEIKGLDLQAHVAPDVPEAFEADRRHLLQILNQLLGNAVKFTERGMVRLDVRRVRPPEGALSDTWLQLAVQDTGIGMSEEQIALAFEAFSQADMSLTRKFGGTGIGLALASELTALLGGHLQASSRPGKGSTFYVTIPVDVPADVGAG